MRPNAPIDLEPDVIHTGLDPKEAASLQNFLYGLKKVRTNLTGFIEEKEVLILEPQEKGMRTMKYEYMTRMVGKMLRSVLPE